MRSDATQEELAAAAQLWRAEHDDSAGDMPIADAERYVAKVREIAASLELEVLAMLHQSTQRLKRTHRVQIALVVLLGCVILIVLAAAFFFRKGS